MNVLYIRTDFWFGLKAGGSVAHTAGVVRGLRALGHSVTILETDRVPLPGLDVSSHVARPWWLLRQPVVRALGPLIYNAQARSAGRRLARRIPVDLIYQRHASLSCAGALLSRDLCCPLVLEVNNLILPWAREMDDVWTLRMEPLVRALERKALRGASLLSAVSRPVRDQLLAVGQAPDRIIVNPNGVDADVFRPDLDAGQVRARLGLAGRRVVGFIGTFSRWHGVEELARAIPRVAERRRDVSFLLVGDGPLRARAQQIVEDAGAGGHVRFTGLVPQAEAPHYLAACDVLVSPHGKPRTGPFIGSPTKLFEYMAMGRGIVASDLDQIGEVLEHGKTALLVAPGDVVGLAEGILRLVDEPDLAGRLGQRAREVVLKSFTWRHNVERILAALPHASTNSAKRHAESGAA